MILYYTPGEKATTPGKIVVRFAPLKGTAPQAGSSVPAFRKAPDTPAAFLRLPPVNHMAAQCAAPRPILSALLMGFLFSPASADPDFYYSIFFQGSNEFAQISSLQREKPPLSRRTKAVFHSESVACVVPANKLPASAKLQTVGIGGRIEKVPVFTYLLPAGRHCAGLRI